MDKSILKADLEELKTYLEHALQRIFFNTHETREFIKDALAKIKKMEDYE